MAESVMTPPRYQPVVDLHTAEIEGVQVVPPSDLVAGASVMDEVARQAREWETQGMRLEIALKLSARQLRQPDLLTRMRARLAASQVPFERFVIEVGETSILGDFESTLALLCEIKASGFRIAIGGFGVELSSLSRLLEMPADVLKIDRSFIAALSTAPKAPLLVEMIIQIAEKLGMRTHAEGVETEAERRFLVANGCEHGHGCLFSKPVPASQVRELHLESVYSQIIPLRQRGAISA
jgi:EAL domain-containing protein (putative c-di-GMP-specific phosphodiesterase class I)